MHTTLSHTTPYLDAWTPHCPIPHLTSMHGHHIVPYLSVCTPHRRISHLTSVYAHHTVPYHTSPQCMDTTLSHITPHLDVCTPHRPISHLTLVHAHHTVPHHTSPRCMHTTLSHITPYLGACTPHCPISHLTLVYVHHTVPYHTSPPNPCELLQGQSNKIGPIIGLAISIGQYWAFPTLSANSILIKLVYQLCHNEHVTFVSKVMLAYNKCDICVTVAVCYCLNLL